MDNLEDGVRYLVRERNGKSLYVGRWLGTKRIALYVECGATASPLAFFLNEKSAIEFMETMGEIR